MVIDCHTHVGIELGQYLTGGFPYGQHLSDLVSEGGAHGIDRWIVFPMVTHLAQNIEALRDGKVLAEGALETVPYAWENRRLMFEITTLFPDAGRATLPFAMFDPARQAEAQAQALRALREEYSFYGLKTQTTMLQSPIKSLLAEGRIFLELAQEWNLPVLIHSSVNPSDLWAQATDILDVAEQWPQVRFCLAHSCRFDRICLDRVAALPNCWFDCSAHGIHCVLATQNHPTVAPVERRFDSDYSRPGQVLCDLAAAYSDKLMWGSDAPYYSFASRVVDSTISLLSTYGAEVKYFDALPPAARQRAGYDNTLAFLGLETLAQKGAGDATI
jgi:predicted TIM-barrel fold metal-dependent hydrolase